MMTLRDTVAPKFGLDRRLRDGNISVDLLQLAFGSCLDRRLHALRDRSVLIATRSQLAAAVALIELDGLVRRLVLCPPGLSAAHIAAVMEDAQVCSVVTDEDVWRVGEAALFKLRLPRFKHMAHRHVRDIETEWVLLTSGTAGRPKLVVHNLASLTQAFAQDTQSSPAWATFYDIRRYGGLQVLLRALVGGGSMTMFNTDGSLDHFLAKAAGAGVTHFSGTPSHWRRALMSTSIHSIAPEYIRLSGEIADQGLLDRLRSAFPRTKIVHAFASTEAGVAFEVGDGQAGFPVEFLDRQQDTVALRLCDGSLCIRSARTAMRYLGTDTLLDEDGFVDTGDMIELRGDRCHFVGRRGGIINVGGLKVHPEEIEAIINKHPQVQVSRVGARKNPITGAIVTADVVFRPQPEAVCPAAIERMKMEVAATCRTALPPHKVPAIINVVGSLEMAASGKLARAIV